MSVGFQNAHDSLLRALRRCSRYNQTSNNRFHSTLKDTNTLKHAHSGSEAPATTATWVPRPAQEATAPAAPRDEPRLQRSILRQRRQLRRRLMRGGLRLQSLQLKARR